MNKIITPAMAMARNFAVFSLFFCLSAFAAAIFAFEAIEAVELDEVFTAIINYLELN
jgi:hypothetical protein